MYYSIIKCQDCKYSDMIEDRTYRLNDTAKRVIRDCECGGIVLCTEQRPIWS